MSQVWCAVSGVDARGDEPEATLVGHRVVGQYQPSNKWVGEHPTNDELSIC